MYQVVHGTPTPVRQLRPDIPEWVLTVLARLMAPAPADRFPSAEAAAEALEAGLPVALPPAPRPVPPPGRPRWLWASAATGVALGVAAAVLTHQPAPRSEAALTPEPSAALPPPEVGPPEVAPPPRPALPPTFVNRFGIGFVLLRPGRGVAEWKDQVQTYNQSFDVPRPIYFGTHEVTIGQWRAVMGPTESRSEFDRKGSSVGRAAVAKVPDAVLDRYPVNGVTWYDAADFLRTMNRKAAESGWVYRLPDNEEWEYAARGGPLPHADPIGYPFYLRNGPSHVLSPDQASFGRPPDAGPKPVGSFPPNRLGIYDLHGNVYEFTDYINHKWGEHFRVIRGGWWGDSAEFCAVTRRAPTDATKTFRGSGFRVVRVPVGDAVSP